MSKDNGKYKIQFDERDLIAVRETLNNCALVAITLSKMPDGYYPGHEMQVLGERMAEVCLQGLTALNNGRVVKKPGRPRKQRSIKK
jgi:hypothetical protein